MKKNKQYILKLFKVISQADTFLSKEMLKQEFQVCLRQVKLQISLINLLKARKLELKRRTKLAV